MNNIIEALGKTAEAKVRVSFNRLSTYRSPGLKNPEARKLAARIIEADKRVGAKAEELDREIQSNKALEKIYKDSMEEYTEKGSFVYERKKKRLADTRKEITALIAQRDDILNNELSGVEYKTLLTKYINCYEADTHERVQELRKIGNTLITLLTEQIEQSEAYDKYLRTLEYKLNSSSHDSIIKGVTAKHVSLATGKPTCNHNASRVATDIEYLSRMLERLNDL